MQVKRQKAKVRVGVGRGQLQIKNQKAKIKNNEWRGAARLVLWRDIFL
jgi:hypothetical protein